MTGIPKTTLSPIVFGFIVTSGWFTNLIFTALSPILPQIAKSLPGQHGAEFAAEMVMALPGLGIALGGIFSGQLLDWIGRRNMTVLSVILYGIAGSAGMWLSDPVMLGASRALVGFFGATYGTALGSLTADMIGVDRRARMIGYQGAFSGVVNVVGALAGGFIAARFDWHAVFALYGISALILLAPAFMVATDVDHAATTEQPSALSAVKAAWPVLLLSVPLLALAVISITQVPFILAQDGFSDTGTRAMIISLAPVFQIVGSVIYGWLQTRAGFRATLLIGLTIAGIGVIIVGALANVGFITTGVGLAGLGAGIYTAYLGHKILEVPLHLRGRAIGFMHTALFLGVLLNPVALAPLRAAFGLTGALEAAGAIAIFCAAAGAVWRTNTPAPLSIAPRD